MQKILIKGPVGNIEAIIDPTNDKASPLAVICHPHPLYSGTMQNKVVTTLAKTFSEAGATTVRFNFRGVGETEGVHDEGVGELDDFLAVISWARDQGYTGPLWLAGFSFGGWVALRGAILQGDKVAKLIQIAPQVSRVKDLPIDKLKASSWILVQGENDEVIDPNEVFAWVDSLDNPPDVIRIPNCGHFFSWQADRVAGEVIG